MGQRWAGQGPACVSTPPSAGTFSLLRENFSHAPSPDMSPASLCALEQLMVAQAQECVFEGLSPPASMAPQDCLAQLRLAQEAAQVSSGTRVRVQGVGPSWGQSPGPGKRELSRLLPCVSAPSRLLSCSLGGWSGTWAPKPLPPGNGMKRQELGCQGGCWDGGRSGWRLGRERQSPPESGRPSRACHVHRQVAAEYRLVHQTMAQPPVHDYMPVSWTALVHVKAEYFRSLAHYHVAMALCDGSRECPPHLPMMLQRPPAQGSWPLCPPAVTEGELPTHEQVFLQPPTSCKPQGPVLPQELEERRQLGKAPMDGGPWGLRWSPTVAGCPPPHSRCLPPGVPMLTSWATYLSLDALCLMGDGPAQGPQECWQPLSRRETPGSSLSLAPALYEAEPSCTASSSPLWHTPTAKVAVMSPTALALPTPSATSQGPQAHMVCDVPVPRVQARHT